MKYARIQDGKVAEIILPFVTTEDMRPPMPEPLGADATEDQQAVYAEAKRGHDEFFVGEVPIEQRFTPELVATMVGLQDDLAVAEGWGYDGSSFSPPPPPPLPTAAEVLGQRDALLALAAIRIAPLQDAVDLGDATAQETASLTAWKQYRVLLNRIPQQPGYPGNVTWPTQPA